MVISNEDEYDDNDQLVVPARKRGREESQTVICKCGKFQTKSYKACNGTKQLIAHVVNKCTLYQQDNNKLMSCLLLMLMLLIIMIT